MSKRKDAMQNLLAPVTAGSGSEEVRKKPAVQSGALKSMNFAFESLTEQAEEASSLREQLEAGDVIVELDPALIDSAIIKDRIDEYETAEFKDFQESLKSHGQIMPVLVRPHPGKAGRYQLAFGHRRVEAQRRNGLMVRAVVRNLDDDSLIIAQGKENLDREDLSFIERALFAFKLEKNGVKRNVILASLSTHKGNLSTMISLVQQLPEELILAVGPAPKIGRPRWEELAMRLQNDPSFDWPAVIDNNPFKKLSSDRRFETLLKATSVQRNKASNAKKILNKAGVPFAQVAGGKKTTKFTVDEKIAPGFATHLAEILPELLSKFEEKSEQKRS